jgi:hypothetical protein
MQFRILIDRPIDGAQEAALLQNLQMLVKIPIASRGLRHVVVPADSVGSAYRLRRPGHNAAANTLRFLAGGETSDLTGATDRDKPRD